MYTVSSIGEETESQNRLSEKTKQNKQIKKNQNKQVSISEQ